jgi:hypothetical protein
VQPSEKLLSLQTRAGRHHGARVPLCAPLLPTEYAQRALPVKQGRTCLQKRVRKIRPNRANRDELPRHAPPFVRLAPWHSAVGPSVWAGDGGLRALKQIPRRAPGGTRATIRQEASATAERGAIYAPFAGCGSRGGAGLQASAQPQPAVPFPVLAGRDSSLPPY